MLLPNEVCWSTTIGTLCTWTSGTWDVNSRIHEQYKRCVLWRAWKTLSWVLCVCPAHIIPLSQSGARQQQLQKWYYPGLQADRLAYLHGQKIRLSISPRDLNAALRRPHHLTYHLMQTAQIKLNHIQHVLWVLQISLDCLKSCMPCPTMMCKPVMLACDASRYTSGALCLLDEKELLAASVCTKFRDYIYGTHLIVETSIKSSSQS